MTKKEKETTEIMTKKEKETTEIICLQELYSNKLKILLIIESRKDCSM